jgi:hypothetical protein
MEIKKAAKLGNKQVPASLFIFYLNKSRNSCPRVPLFTNSACYNLILSKFSATLAFFLWKNTGTGYHSYLILGCDYVSQAAHQHKKAEDQNLSGYQQGNIVSTYIIMYSIP